MSIGNACTMSWCQGFKKKKLKKIKCQVCLEEEDGVRYHVHLQDINKMKNEDGGVQCRRWMKTVACALKLDEDGSVRC